MAGPTAQAQRERIEAIVATIVVGSIPPIPPSVDPTPVYMTVHSGPECPVADDDLPMAIVLARGATRASSNTDKLLTTRQFDIIILVSKICNDSVEEQRRVFDATEALIDVLPDYFFHNARRLKLSGDTLDGAWDVGNITDDGPEFRQWGGEVFGAITHRMPVISKR